MSYQPVAGSPVYYSAPPPQQVYYQQQPVVTTTVYTVQRPVQQQVYYAPQPQSGYAAMYGPQPYYNDGRFGPHWTHDACSCCDDSDECLDTWCCHYCKIGWMHHRLEKGTVAMDPLACCGSCCVDALFLVPFATMAMTYMTRTKMMQRYGIIEDGLSTFAWAICLPACALCQQAREMKVRGESCGGTCCVSAAPPAPMGMAGAPAPYGQQQAVYGQPQQPQPQQYGEPQQAPPKTI